MWKSQLECQERHARFAPPWCERLLTSELGPTYGPQTDDAYARRLRAHRDSIYGGGLWDPGEDVHRRGVERYDVLEVEELLARIGHLLGPRQLEAAYGYWRDRYSCGQVARRMGVAVSTVREWVKRIRQRVHG